MNEFKIGDWVYTDVFNVSGFDAGVYEVVDTDNNYGDSGAIRVKVTSEFLIWCYPPNGNITRLAYPYEIPSRPTISKEQKKHLLNLISSI